MNHGSFQATTTCSALALAAVLVSTLSAPVSSAWAQVQVQSLAAPDLFLDAGGADGTARRPLEGRLPGVVKEALPKLATKPLSPAAAGLARRVLATGANAPAGIGDDPELGATRPGPDRPGRRQGRRRRAGPRPQRGEQRPAVAGGGRSGPDHRRRRQGLQDRRGADGRWSAPYWLRLRAFCQAIGDQHDAAQLTFTLAAQQTKDADYARLMNALLSATPAGAANLKNGINYALSRKLGLDLSSAAAVATASPALKAVAKPVEAPSDLTAAQASTLAALRGAKGLVGFTDAAQANLPAIAALARADAPLEDPVLLARAALAAADLATAQAIRAKLTGDAIPGATTTDLALLDATVAAAEGKKDNQVLDGLIERGVQGGAKSPAQPAALILAAVGAAVGPEARAAFAGFDPGKSVAPAGRLIVLDDAAAAGRQGETALLALSIAADAGPAGPGPVDRARLVRALCRRRAWRPTPAPSPWRGCWRCR